MMNYFIVTTQCRVFIFENIKTVWTGSDNFFDTIVVQRLNILVGHHLKQELITGAPCGITITPFLFSQYRILDPNFFQDRGKRFCNFLSPLVKTSGTTYPEQDLGTIPFSKEFSDRWYFHFEMIIVVINLSREI